jgi:hypothetical protein
VRLGLLRDARPGVLHLDADGVVAVAAVRRTSRPVPPIASAALSMRLVHTWLSSAPYAGTRGRVASYSRTTSTPASLWPEHHDGAVEAGVQVDVLARAESM